WPPAPPRDRRGPRARPAGGRPAGPASATPRGRRSAASAGAGRRPSAGRRAGRRARAGGRGGRRWGRRGGRWNVRRPARARRAAGREGLVMLAGKRLRVLRDVAQHGSFSAAGEALGYTQSAVSQQIAALEREAGSTLVERNARGVRLTGAGRALVEHADGILARVAAAEDELDAIAGLRGGRLRLASFPTAGAT